MTHPNDALRLVPVKLTPKMIAAARGFNMKNVGVQGRWEAMLAAAPASPLPEGGGQCSGISGQLSGWQDISTAPKDGTKVLGWSDGDFTVVEWSSGGYWTLSECGAYASDGEWWPTHWQPLPAAPTGAK